MSASLDPLGAYMPVKASTTSRTAEEADYLHKELDAQLSGSVLVRSVRGDASMKASPGQAPPSHQVASGSCHGLHANMPQNGSASKDKDFDESVRLFNSAAKCHSTLIVKPKTTQDVSATLRFCRKYGLSPCIKSGGYSTAGWATSGDVIIDFQLMDDVRLMWPRYAESLASSAVEAIVKSPEPLELPPADAPPSIGQFSSRVRKAEEAFTESTGGDASRQRLFDRGVGREVRPQPIASTSRRSESGDGTPESAEWVDKVGSGEMPRTGSNESASTTSMSRTDSTSVDSGSADDHEHKARSNDAIVEQSMPQRTSPDAAPSTSLVDPSLPRAFGSGSTSIFEHERWHRHHRPPNASGLSASRIQTSLPDGAFVWRQGEDPTALNASGQPFSRGQTASQDTGTLSNSMPSGRSEASTGATPALRSLDLDGPTQRSDFNTCALRPGIHSDKFLLASFGPGASIPQLDAHTDRAGRLGLIGDQRTSSSAAASDLDHGATTIPSSNYDANYTPAPYFVPSSAYPVGAASMVTGGFGFVTRAYGLSVDNVVEMEMVLADGSVHTLNDENAEKSQDAADLWWAARGAATCLGVVTHITMKAYPVPHVYGGSLLFPFSPSTADDLVRHWRDVLKGDIPRELYANLILTEGPGGSHVIVIQICDLRGRTADSEAVVQALSSWSGERILLKDIEERPFQAQNQFMAQVLRDTGAGKRWLVRGDCLDTLTDECIDATVSNFSRSTRGSRVLIFELARGALTDATPASGCISQKQRQARYALGSIWSGDVDDEQHVAQVDSWVSGTSKHSPIPCFLERAEGIARVRGSFGRDNFERLLAIKRKVDPENIFRHSFLGTLSEEQSLR